MVWMGSRKRISLPTFYRDSLAVAVEVGTLGGDMQSIEELTHRVFSRAGQSGSSFPTEVSLSERGMAR
jgi:hypothetical protein